MNIDILELDLVSLKAMFFDELRKKELAEKNISLLVTEINKRENESSKVENE